jgi:hypothetical protein
MRIPAFDQTLQSLFKTSAIPDYATLAIEEITVFIL